MMVYHKIMSGFPRSPRLTKGAIVSIDLPSPIPQVIIFQYNPDSLTRTLEPKTSEGEGDRSEALRLKGAPVETISLDMELDATDQLERPDQNPIATSMGVYPQLAALEMILYPKMAGIITNVVLAALGIQEVVPPEGPFTLFIWGPKRVLPVRLTKFSITEEAYDINLNPIRAKVSLTLSVLSYDDFAPTHLGYYVFAAHQVIKETMAAIGSVGSLAGVASGSAKLF